MKKNIIDKNKEPGTENEYVKFLVKPGTIKKAVKSLICLIEGKHPADDEKTVDAKLVLAASQLLLDKAIPTKKGVDVFHNHKFTEIPIEQVKVSEKDKKLEKGKQKKA